MPVSEMIQYMYSCFQVERQVCHLRVEVIAGLVERLLHLFHLPQLPAEHHCNNLRSLFICMYNFSRI